MKRRNLAIIYLLILTIGTILSLYIPKQEVVTANAAMSVIPDEAIRLRILANSDREADQAVKRLIRDQVNQDITSWVAQLTSLEEARKVIISHMNEIQATAESVIEEQGLNQSVKVDFGQAAFPTKLYGQFLYPAGDYEAVIITLGEGEGANWWCVLFPPLCFLDFSNGTAVSQSPFDEEEESAAAAVNETEGDAEKVAVANQNEVVADKPEEEVKTEGQVEETTRKTAVEAKEEVKENSQLEAEDAQVEEQADNQTNEEAISEVDSKSDSKDREEQVNSEKIAEEIPNEAADTVDEEKVIASEPIYNGTEEPQIVKKSLFAEIFTKLF